MLTIRGLEKSFGSTKALSGVNLTATAGEVMAVIGENGAGKSSLMQILAGAFRADAGTIHLGGQPHLPETPLDAQRAGVALVPQEAELVGDLNVAENIVLGREPTRHWLVQRSLSFERATQALAEVTTDEHPIELWRPARELGPSERQRVVIARAISQPDLRLLIFDEPTSSLTAADVKRLFSVITRLKQRGLAVLYVSHFLEEVLQIADRFSVLRDGRSVGCGAIQGTTATDLVTLMAGAPLGPTERGIARERGAVVLDVRQLAGTTLPCDASFQLHAGEVLGIAGLVGAGRTELLRSIFGLAPIRGGQVRVGTLHGPLSPQRCLDHGLGLLSEDRRREGLAQSLSVADNVTLSKLPSLGPFVTALGQNRASQSLISRLGIRCQSTAQAVSELSGGNQQKVALARLLHHDVDILLLDEPTRGIDVRSRADVHACIDELVRRGKAVLLVSSYLPELLEMSDRIAVMRRGRLGPVKPAREWTEHALLLQATGTE